MEEEAEKLKELQNEVEKQMNLSPPPGQFKRFYFSHTGLIGSTKEVCNVKVINYS